MCCAGMCTIHLRKKLYQLASLIGTYEKAKENLRAGAINFIHYTNITLTSYFLFCKLRYNSVLA
jgi:hypothetical protein